MEAFIFYKLVKNQPEKDGTVGIATIAICQRAKKTTNRDLSNRRNFEVLEMINSDFYIAT